MLIKHLKQFVDDRTSTQLPRSPYRIDDFDPQPGEVVQSLVVPVSFLVMAAGLWIAVLVAYSAPRPEALPAPDPKIVVLLNRTYFSINAIKHLNDSMRVQQLLDEWEEISRDWVTSAAVDGAVAEVLSSIRVNLRRACGLVKPEAGDPIQVIEYDALRQGFLNGAARNAERIRKIKGISYAEAHGSGQFLSATTEFLQDVSRILTSMRELQATKASYEAMDAIKRLHEKLPESFVRIPAVSEVSSIESQSIEKLFVLINAALKDYEQLCQLDPSGTDSSEARADATRRFYEDLRTAEELFAKTENDVVGIKGLAAFKSLANTDQSGKKDSQGP